MAEGTGGGATDGFRAFLAGLVLGLIVGALAGAFLPPLFASEGTVRRPAAIPSTERDPAPREAPRRLEGEAPDEQDPESSDTEEGADSESGGADDQASDEDPGGG